MQHPSHVSTPVQTPIYTPIQSDAENVNTPSISSVSPQSSEGEFLPSREMKGATDLTQNGK